MTVEARNHNHTIGVTLLERTLIMEKDKTNDSLEHCIVIKLAFVEVSLAVYQKKSFVC